MSDMICSLIDLPPLAGKLDALRQQDITIRRPHPWEQTRLRDFILKHFTQGWADETSVAFHRQPVTAYVALRGGREIIGFAAYECSRRDYFGPTGVDPAWQGKGIGRVLFIAALRGLRELGYTYAIIGDAGPTDFYRRVVGAEEINIGDGKGIYTIKEEPGLS